MRKRGIVGLIAVAGVVLAFAAVSKAQKARKPAVLALSISEPAKEEPQGWVHREALVEQKTVTVRNAVDPHKMEAIGNGDPMAAVDAFLDRNRKEADDSIQALTREAESIRARLEKVEAALTRWQSVSESLNRKFDQTLESSAPKPAQRIKWRQPETVPTPTVSLPPADEPAPLTTPTSVSPEGPAAPAPVGVEPASTPPPTLPDPVPEPTSPVDSPPIPSPK